MQLKKIKSEVNFYHILVFFEYLTPTPCQYVSFGILVRKYNSPITLVMSHVVGKTQNLTMRPYPEGMGFSVCFKLLKNILSVLNINSILLSKLFWPTVRKNCSSDWEKLFKVSEITIWINLFKQWKVRTIFGNRMLV